MGHTPKNTFMEYWRTKKKEKSHPSENCEMENQTLFLAVLLQDLQDWSFLEHIALLAEPKRGDR